MNESGAPPDRTHEGALRQDMMRICALATEAELASALAQLAPLPEASDVRTPEIGLVMLQGRVGGDGAPFNVGEVTVTRAAVKLATGELGNSYLLGRSMRKARLAAIVDALGQSSHYAARLAAALAEPVQQRVARELARRAAETNATKVEFFTMKRGEDTP